EGPADRAVGREQLLGEDLADLAQPAGVVAGERLVDDVGGGDVSGHRRRCDASLADTVEIAWILAPGCSGHRSVVPGAGNVPIPREALRSARSRPRRSVARFDSGVEIRFQSPEPFELPVALPFLVAINTDLADRLLDRGLMEFAPTLGFAEGVAQMIRAGEAI